MSIRFKTRAEGIKDSGLCEPHLNLLAHAQSIELDIGSECGGHGICGRDRVRIPVNELGAFSAPTDHEREHLTESDLGFGIRLACQVFPESEDLQTELEALLS